jgi:phosphate acyltransferase
MIARRVRCLAAPARCGRIPSVIRIIVDAMGGDDAPRQPVAGAVRAARAFGKPIVLVGRQPDIEAELAAHDHADLDLTVVHAPDVIAMHELAPASAVRSSPDSSIARGMTLVRQGHAGAFVTMGHTGAALAGATFRLGRLHGVLRPGLATPFPTVNGRCVMIDIGANADVRPAFLAQFGVMGAAYAERVLGIANPRVGLVSNGEERGKGSAAVQQAVPLLEASGVNFIGNIEGRDIPLGTADVVVLDGFTGNVLVKFAEGTPALVASILRQSLAGDLLAIPTGLLLRRLMQRARSRMDYRSTGGAVLLGVRGVVVIGHGRSDAEAVTTAIGVAVRAVENGLVEAIASGITRVATPWSDRGQS